MIARMIVAALLVLSTAGGPAAAQAGEEPPLYLVPRDETTQWFSFENNTGEQGKGALENAGQKGHPFDRIPAGGSVVLADARGAGIVRRIWLTIDDRSPEMLRALRLEMYWDGAVKPAVSVPLGDFFAAGHGKLVPMDTALIASPEGRSFLSYIPMPFRKRARIVLTNTSGKALSHLYYDVNMTRAATVPSDALYFHASWHHVPRTMLGEPFEILPRVSGRGRFLGTSIAISANPAYRDTWWGEGEVMMYLDGDRDNPSLVGTGTEDYIGSAWELGTYINRYQGAPIADAKARKWSLYRFHIPDPIYFQHDIRVVWQQLGGAPRDKFLELERSGAPVRAVTFDRGSRESFVKLLDEGKGLSVDDRKPGGGVVFQRQDDVSAVAYYYLDRPAN